MVQVETQMQGFDRRMGSVEGKIDGVLGKLDEFIIATNQVANKPSFEPLRVIDFLLKGASLLALVAYCIIYIANSQVAARLSAAETVQTVMVTQLAELSKSRIVDMKEELAELRRRVGWKAEITASR